MDFPKMKTNFTENDYYSFVDLNRVGKAVNYIADKLKNYGYIVSASAKIDWSIHDEIKESDMSKYLDNVKEIKNVFYGHIDLPETMRYITNEDANNIERLLVDVDGRIKNMEKCFFFSGELFCGEV